MTIRTRDGRDLHFERTGEGSPTVVFEAGMGCSRDAWALVAPAIAARTSTVTYDRSGLGRSPADTQARTFERLVDDLCDLLDSLGDAPYVLVGHSWGGPIVRGAATRQPDRIAGLVLVDQADEGCPDYFRRTTVLQHRAMYATLPLLARAGLLRRGIAATARALPPEVAVRYMAENSSTSAARGLQAEGRSFNDDLARLRDEPLVVPNVPVSIISGTKRARTGNAKREAIIAAHARRAASLPKGRHVCAERSGHLVMFTEPEIVIDEIEHILDEIA